MRRNYAGGCGYLCNQDWSACLFTCNGALKEPYSLHCRNQLRRFYQLRMCVWRASQN